MKKKKRIKKIFEVHFMNERRKANLCHGKYSIEDTLSAASSVSFLPIPEI